MWHKSKFYFKIWLKKSLCERVLYMGGYFYEARIGVRCGEQRSKASGLHQRCRRCAGAVCAIGRLAREIIGGELLQ